MKAMKVVVLLSGGVDSCALLWWAKQEYAEVLALSFRYRAQHNFFELRAAEWLAKEAGVAHTVLEIPDIFGPSFLSGDSNDVVVPGRNVVFAAMAVAFALRHGADKILVGPTKEDYRDFPDCRPEFWDNLEAACIAAYGIGIDALFVHKSKAEVVALGWQLGAPLYSTVSCYRGQPPCGQCLACTTRYDAFDAAHTILRKQR